MNIPLISVIIPCFNHGKYIQEALDSVLQYHNQGDVEIIIVNDGSTEQLTIDKLSEIHIPNVQVIHQSNSGLGNARNTGIKSAKGKYILPLDSDNKIFPEYISESIKIMESKPDIGVVYSNSIIFSDENKRLKYNRVRDFEIKYLLLANYIDACAVYRKSAWELAGGYAEDMPVMGMEDWEFWINLSSKGVNFFHIKKHLYYYRNVPNSMIKQSGSKSAEAAKYIIQKHQNLYALHLAGIATALQYPLRKPFQHLIRCILGKPFIPQI
ncbi:MAG: glycosyltransferase family 2 protein [Cytophagales bacterium]|nr:glycosyltransferase family 2 protein [Cytophagales bacterium]